MQLRAEKKTLTTSFKGQQQQQQPNNSQWQFIADINSQLFACGIITRLTRVISAAQRRQVITSRQWPTNDGTMSGH